MTIVEFLLARIAEDEHPANPLLHLPERWGGERVARRIYAECAAKRAIIEFHRNWPVLVEQRPVLEMRPPRGLDGVTMRMTQQMDWLTEQEYRRRFGTEPPHAPAIRALAAIYADHPDYDDNWKP